MFSNQAKYSRLQEDEGFFDKSNWRRALLKWGEYTSPFRPSKGDIGNYSSILRSFAKKREKKILLLGSTPEIREILSRLDLFPIVADFSSRMISGMLVFGPLINESKETWIRADWMDLNEFLKIDYFDVIIGDLFLRNIDFESQDKSLENISRLLKKNAHFITRIHFLNEGLVELSSAEIIKSVFEKYKHKKTEKKIVEDLIASRLFDKNTDFDSKTVNKETFSNDVESCRKGARNKIERLILNNISEKWTGKRTWTQRTRREIDRLLSKHFMVCAIKIAGDYQDSEFYPIYILKNKKK